MSSPRAQPPGMNTTVGAGPPSVFTERLKAGESVGRYAILEELGEGGMAVVYAAYDPELDRKVALKLVKSDAFAHDGSDGKRRLLREAQALARLSHPNVVPVHDAGTDRGEVFLTMEYVEGVNPRQWIRAENPSCDEILTVYAGAGRGLVAAHEAGLVHRDFKPDNVMLGRDGRVRVMDFGLANAGQAPAEDDDPSRPLTGTLAYMAAEQFSRLPTGPATDQFAFCVSIWEALYRTRPFRGDSPALLGLAVIRGEVESPPAKSSVPARVEKALRRGLRTEPNERWPSMDDLLDEIRPSEPTRARAWLWVALASTGVAGAVVLSEDTDPCKNIADALEATWNADQRARVQASFEATKLPLAKSTAPRVQAALDAYANRWRAARQEVCRAKPSDVTQTWLACLQRRRADFAGVVSTLVMIEDSGVARAIETVQRLDEIERCADPVYLRAAQPVPVDGDTQRRVEELRTTLSKAEAMLWAGEGDQALALAEEAEGVAQKIGYLPAHAEALVVLAGAYPPQHNEGEGAAQRAWLLALESGHDAAALSAATTLVRLYSDKPAEYEQWSANARAFLARTQPGPRAEALLLRSEARALSSQRRYSEATKKLDEAVSLVEGLEPDFLVVEAWADKALISQKVGRNEDALAQASNARRLARQVFGEEHPIQVQFDRTMGNVLFRLGRHAEALAYLDDAVERAETAYGKDHPAVGSVLGAVANSLMQSGKPEEALSLYERTYNVFRAAFGPDAPDAIRSASNWGVALDLAGRPHESVEKHEMALAAVEKQSNPDPSELASTLDNLGSALQGTGAYDRAEPMHRRAATLWEDALGAEHPSLAISLRDHARALIGLGRSNEAVALLRRSVAIFDGAQIDPLEAATTRVFLAHALQEAGLGGDEANRERERALLAFDAAGEIGRKRWESLQDWGRIKSPSDPP